MTTNARGAQHPLAKHGIEGCYAVDADGCWVWQRSSNADGYGTLRRAGRGWSAHRYSWTLTNGDIPEGMTVDHICFNTLCVNPEHLRLLTLSENSANRRPMRRRGDYCKHGHEFTPENARFRNERGRGTTRYCRECQRLDCQRRRDAKKKAESIKAEVAALQVKS